MLILLLLEVILVPSVIVAVTPWAAAKSIVIVIVVVIIVIAILMVALLLLLSLEGTALLVARRTRLTIAIIIVVVIVILRVVVVAVGRSAPVLVHLTLDLTLCLDLLGRKRELMTGGRHGIRSKERTSSSTCTVSIWTMCSRRNGSRIGRSISAIRRGVVVDSGVPRRREEGNAPRRT